MKKILLISFLVTTFYASACSCSPIHAFCQLKTVISYDVIVFGQILDTNSINIHVKRFYTLEGVENRDTITIWNDADYLCSPGFHSMKASKLGIPGDSVFLILPRIDSLINSWDILGDYRMPDDLCGNPNLKVVNDTVRKPINYGLDFTNPMRPTYIHYSNVALNDFLTFMSSNQNHCVSISDTTFDYIPFPEGQATWIDSTNVNSFSKCQEFETKRTKDTLIDGLKYQKLVQYHQERFQCANVVSYSSQTTYGFYRNDVANRKVWLRLPNSNTDTLLYDFKLKIGDTLPETYLNDRAIVQAKVIDSIKYLLIGDRYRRVYYYNGICNSGFNTQALIEGIGKTDGTFKPIEPCFLAAGYTKMTCFSVNSTRLYPDSGIACRLITSVNKNYSINREIEIYPNPTTGIVNIESDKQINSISIFDMQGRLIQSFVTLSTSAGSVESGVEVKTKQLELPEKSGLYLKRIETAKGKVINRKVLRN